MVALFNSYQQYACTSVWRQAESSNQLTNSTLQLLSDAKPKALPT